jgi:5-methylcytosine-specific restriction endonuclease McrA
MKYICKKCDKTFSRNKESKFCSKECYRQSLIGKASPFKGEKHSMETIEKIRMANFGKVSWNKGKSPSEEALIKMRAAGKKRIALGFLMPSRKGVKFTEEQRKRRSALMSGENHPMWKGGISKDPNYFREHAREWALRNPERANHSKHVRRILERNAEGTHSIEDWAKMKMIFCYTCPACWRSEPEIELTKDHIVPLRDGGTDYIENIQPLCRSCNSRKNATEIDYREYFAVIKTLSSIIYSV